MLHGAARQADDAARKSQNLLAGAGHVVAGDAELARAAERLLRLAQSSDEAVGSAFTLSARGQTLARVRQPGFWASLDEAAALAAAITRAYQD